VELLGKFWLWSQISSKFYSIATDWKATDWLIANCYLQEQILNNSKDLLKMRAFMLCCATARRSLKVKFNRDVTQLETFQVESWLNYHGEKLEKRFQLSAYKMMNQL
jgi:homoserine acetyltransferase